MIANDFQNISDEIRRNIEVFRFAAQKRRLTGALGTSEPIRLNISSPASEAQIRAVEESIGEALPPALRQFYGTFSAAIDICWLIPGHKVYTPEAVMLFEFETLPPPPLQYELKIFDWSTPIPQPVVIGGQVSFSLRDTARELANARDMRERLHDDATYYRDICPDENLHLHHLLLAQWWERGFPLCQDGSGNVMAIDSEDEKGRLLWLQHDGTDLGGFIEHDLMDFMLVQSRLGFPGFNEIEPIFTPPVRGDREQRYLLEHPKTTKPKPFSRRLDDSIEAARIWRDWLGMS
ncbi:SMI1 / KNR4 family protein [compost metagenome]